MKKAIFALFLIFQIGITCIVGQNSPQLKSWNIAPNTVTFNSQPLLGALPIGSYAGSASYSLINSMHDPYGNLLFFVINENDGSATGNALKIFDKNGDLIDDIKLDIHQGNSYRYWAEEMSIVPIPNSCNKYYLITAATDVYNYTSQHGDFYPLYSILDMDSPNIYDPSKKGALTYFAGTNPTNAIDMSDVSITPFANAYIDNVWRPNRLGIGVTPYRTFPSNDHLFFVNSALGILTYNVTSNGIFYNNNPFNFPSNNTGNSFYSEMEVVMLSNGNYRLAKVLSSTIINIADFDFNGNYITGSFKSIDLVNSIGTNVDDVEPTSLEFSPNGQYLYFSHNIVIGVSNFNIPIHYLDLNSSTLTAVPLPSNYTGINNLEGAHIEMAHDCKMYFNGGTQLYALTNPNNPISATWQPSISLLPDNNNSFTKRLPDQMDGEDYQKVNNSSMYCCIESTKFTALSYTANIIDGFSSSKTQTWTPTNNPFIRLHNDLYPCNTPVTSLSTITIKGDLVIPEGYNITIQGLRFEFAPSTERIFNGYVVTNHGGRVIIQNSTTSSGGRLTLTSFGSQKSEFTVYTGCGPGMWLGVEVWGDAISAQGSFTGINAGKNGWFRMFNSSSISRAYLGAVAGKRLQTNYSISQSPSYGGGVIQASNAIFKNNQIDVQLMPYNTGNSLCYFTNALFITDAPLYSVGNTLQPVPPISHAVLKDVKSIYFRSCKFTNATTSGYGQVNNSNYPIGITADHSHFFCLPAIYGSTNGCTFENLKYGIYASFYNKTKTITVDYCTFNNNYRGIYLNSAQLVPTITRNNFNILSYNTTITNNRAYGLYLNACTNYKVEENYFTTTNGNDNANNIGIIVNNSGPHSNRIYKNTFNILWAGIQAQNLNCYINPIPSPFNPIPNPYGLRILCNNFSQIRERDMGLVAGTNSCIDYYQENLNYPASNRFSHSNNTVYNDYFTYSLTNPIAYLQYKHHIDFAYTPQPGRFIGGSNTGVIPLSSGTFFNPSSNCLTSFNEYHLTPIVGNLKSQIVEYNDSLIFLKQLMENGNNIILLNTINTSNDFGNLRQLLLSKSPYLSDQILITYLSKDGVPYGHIKDVLIQNSPLTSIVLNNLNYLNLPNGIKNQINLAQTNISISERKKLEDLIKNYEFEIEMLKNEILRAYVNDTTVEMQIDSMIKIVKDYEEILDVNFKGKDFLADFYIEKQDYTNADIIISEIETEFEKRNIAKLKKINKNIRQSGGSFYSLILDPISTQLLESIVNEEDVIGYETSIAIMQNVFDQPYIEPILEDNSNHSYVPFENSNLTDTTLVLKLFPNPNNGNMSFELNSNKVLDCKIFIYDLIGRLLVEDILPIDKHIEYSNDILSNGVYIINIEIGNRILASQKLIIIK